MNNGFDNDFDNRLITAGNEEEVDFEPETAAQDTESDEYYELPLAIKYPLLSAYFHLLCASSTTSPYPLPRRLLCLLWCPGVTSASSRDIPLWDLF